MGLLALAACGGGDDATSPPDDQGFSLTVAGEGTGGGRITTAAGVEPALDCTVTGGTSASGACSATYPEGTAVELTVAPAAGSTFDGWSGDAAGCGTAPVCPLTLTADQTAVARLSSSGSGSVEIASDTFYVDPDFGDEGAIIWVVEVRNPTSQMVENVDIDFTTRDAAGAIVSSASTFVGPIPPGETRASQSFADYFGTEMAGEFQISNITFGSGGTDLSAAAIASSDWRADPGFAGGGAVIWTVEVRNTTGSELDLVQVDFSTYNAAGNILAASSTFVGPIPPGGTVSSESIADYRGTEASAKFAIADVR